MKFNVIPVYIFSTCFTISDIIAGSHCKQNRSRVLLNVCYHYKNLVQCASMCLLPLCNYSSAFSIWPLPYKSSSTALWKYASNLTPMVIFLPYSMSKDLTL